LDHGFLITKGFKSFDFKKKKKRQIGLAFPPQFSYKYSMGIKYIFCYFNCNFLYILKFIIYIFNKFVSKFSIHDFFLFYLY